MKIFALVFGLFLAISLAAAPAKDVKILIAGSGWNQIMLISKNTGKAEWVYDIPNHVECNSVVLTKDKNILYTNKANVRLINLKKETLWEFSINKDKEEVHTAIELSNGNIMLAICGKPARILEFDKKGTQKKEITFDTLVENKHGQFRQASKTKKGTYIVAILSRKIILEMNDKGEVLNEVPTSFPVFSIKELPDENWLISGDGGNVQIVNPKTREIVRQINNKNLEDVKILFGTDAKMLKNGNIMISNWNGHSTDKEQPKLFELDKNNKLVWKLETDEPIKNISAFFIL